MAKEDLYRPYTLLGKGQSSHSPHFLEISISVANALTASYASAFDPKRGEMSDLTHKDLLFFEMD